jgi:ESCRT-II complex subunit VPS25
MVARGVAAYEPAKQTRAVLLFWRTPDEWAELLHSWVSHQALDSQNIFFAKVILQASSTGQLNTILTFYDITDPPTPSDLSGLPVPLLRKAIAILARSARAQSIAIADGEGVRFFEGKGT